MEERIKAYGVAVLGETGGVVLAVRPLAGRSVAVCSGGVTAVLRAERVVCREALYTKYYNSLLKQYFSKHLQGILYRRHTAGSQRVIDDHTHTHTHNKRHSSCIAAPI